LSGDANQPFCYSSLHALYHISTSCRSFCYCGSNLVLIHIQPLQYSEIVAVPFNTIQMAIKWRKKNNNWFSHFCCNLKRGLIYVRMSGMQHQYRHRYLWWRQLNTLMMFQHIFLFITKFNSCIVFLYNVDINDWLIWHHCSINLSYDHAHGKYHA